MDNPELWNNIQTDFFSEPIIWKWGFTLSLKSPMNSERYKIPLAGLPQMWEETQTKNYVLVESKQRKANLHISVLIRNTQDLIGRYNDYKIQKIDWPGLVPNKFKSFWVEPEYEINKLPFISVNLTENERIWQILNHSLSKVYYCKIYQEKLSNNYPKMEAKATPTLREKLNRSRSLWMSFSNDRFLYTLYRVLDVRPMINFYKTVFVEPYVQNNHRLERGRPLAVC